MAQEKRELKDTTKVAENKIASLRKEGERRENELCEMCAHVKALKEERQKHQSLHSKHAIPDMSYRRSLLRWRSSNNN